MVLLVNRIITRIILDDSLGRIPVKQAKDKKEQATHSECDPLDNNEGFELDNSASATNLDYM